MIEIDHLRALPVSERIQLVEDLWDSIAAEPESVRLSEAQLVSCSLSSCKKQFLNFLGISLASLGIFWNSRISFPTSSLLIGRGAQTRELDRRLDRFEEAPGEGVEWSALKDHAKRDPSIWKAR